MNFDTIFRRAFFYLVALAIMPLLLGGAFHCLVPCTDESHSVDPQSPCCPHGHDEQENDSTSLPEKPSCSVCDFLAMPRDIAHFVTWDYIPDRVELCESQPILMDVVLYRPFEPGRAPSTLS